MKKYLALLLIVLTTNFAYADAYVDEGDITEHLGDVNIEVNGQVMSFEVPNYIKNSRTIVPVKFLMDELGYEVQWHEETQLVKCIRGDEIIEFTIGDPVLYVNGKAIESDVAPIIIHNRTYVPLSIITRSTGSVVTWNAETFTAGLEEKISTFNMFYGPSSYQNYKANDLSFVDHMSYAWSRIEYIDGEFFINSSSKYSNDMYVPEGFELVMNDEDQYLNLYCDDHFEDLFLQQDQLIQDIKKRMIAPEIGDPEFDGIVIDFEGIPAMEYEAYYDFLETLNENLMNKTIIVALQPKTYDYSRIVDAVDHAIIMVHDYETKSSQVTEFSVDFVDQPITPIKEIDTDIKMIVSDLDVHQKSKLWLQVSLSVVQWQSENDYLYKRYTPNYDALIERMKQLDETDFYYSEDYENPYLSYQDENGKLNTIWYENERSIQAKLDLVKQYNLGGVSIWQLGNFPTETELFDMNIIKQIIENDSVMID